jgi:hypothetical protein
MGLGLDLGLLDCVVDVFRFLMLEDAGGPSYFNNYQQRLQNKLFKRLQMGQVAAGCIFIPQAAAD